MWDNIVRIDSSNENVSKYVFEQKDAIVESVLYKYPTYEERTVICCSTQSGCPVGCRFCGTGDSFIRSLTADEIVSQPVHLMKDRGIDASQVKRMQIMFMSMGEPMLNYAALEVAMRELYALYPQSRLLISTSGPAVYRAFAKLRDLSIEIPTIGLQFSVHESSEVARNKLIPFKDKLSLVEIADEGEMWYAATGRKPFFNYCVHAENNREENANKLYHLFDPSIWEATISVICERDEHVAAANERQRDLAEGFEQLLMQRGFNTRMFDPAGQDDIGGGCGQLWYVQEWMRNNPELARPSIGRGLATVHTPR